MTFPSTCGSCGAPCETRMFVTSILRLQFSLNCLFKIGYHSVVPVWVNRSVSEQRDGFWEGPSHVPSKLTRLFFPRRKSLFWSMLFLESRGLVLHILWTFTSVINQIFHISRKWSLWPQLASIAVTATLRYVLKLLPVSFIESLKDLGFCIIVALAIFLTWWACELVGRIEKVRTKSWVAAWDEREFCLSTNQSIEHRFVLL